MIKKNKFGGKFNSPLCWHGMAMRANVYPNTYKDRAPPKVLADEKVELEYDEKPVVPVYGRPRVIDRPHEARVKRQLGATEQAMANRIKRVNDNKLRPRPRTSPKTTGNDHKHTYEHADHGATRYAQYTSRGPRMPYEMWPQRVGTVEDFDFEPKRYDTYVAMEKEWYDKMHALTRHLWRVEERTPTRRLERIPKKNEEFCTRPQGPMRKTIHVEIDRSEIKPLPDANDALRMHHLWTSIDKLGIKTDKCAKDFTSQFG